MRYTMTVKEIMHESTVLDPKMSILDASKIMKEKENFQNKEKLKN